MHFIQTMISSAAMLGCLAIAAPAIAHEGHEHDQQGATSAPATAGTMSEGEVRKIDKAAAKITIKHGPLHNLDMPAMTMVFKVGDPAMLDAVKEGDKVKFVAEKVKGSLTLTRLESSK
ncbi:MAG TPA: copper-binding protein [Telluria sp.]|nr:copper-binding protein [Telluria sp.]